MTISLAGDIASIVSLFLASYTLYLIKNLKREYRLRVHIKDLSKELQEMNRDLSALLNDFEGNKKEIKEELFKIYAVLRSLLSKSNNPLRKDVKNVLNQIEWCRLKWKINFTIFKTSEDNIREIFAGILQINTVIKIVKSELKWGGIDE